MMSSWNYPRTLIRKEGNFRVIPTAIAWITYTTWIPLDTTYFTWVCIWKIPIRIILSYSTSIRHRLDYKMDRNSLQCLSLTASFSGVRRFSSTSLSLRRPVTFDLFLIVLYYDILRIVADIFTDALYHVVTLNNCKSIYTFAAVKLFVSTCFCGAVSLRI